MFAWSNGGMRIASQSVQRRDFNHKKQHFWRRAFLPLLLVSIAAVSASPCVAEPMPVLPTVGPSEPEHVGYLVVYSATEPYNDGDLMYYTHTDYQLYSARGSFLKKIRNSIVRGDENPEKVPLAPGRYIVEAQSEAQGIVRVPVIIADGRTTVVNLENDRRGRSR
jgi:hypothetical protein